MTFVFDFPATKTAGRKKKPEGNPQETSVREERTDGVDFKFQKKKKKYKLTDLRKRV